MTIQPFVEDTEKPNFAMMMWSGLLSDIPAGWLLCDGNNGTPDMRDRFVDGTGNASKSPGANHGTDSYTLITSQLPSHDHSGSTNTAGSHSHNIKCANVNGGSWNDDLNWQDIEGTNTKGSSHETLNTGSSGGHSHSFNVGSTGSGNSIDNRPSFYEVAFIMKS